VGGLAKEDDTGARGALDQLVVVGRHAGEGPQRAERVDRGRPSRALEQRAHVDVGRLREVLVPGAHRVQRPRRL
jgi:hypothetical protein